jgi:hypothetical protein
MIARDYRASCRLARARAAPLAAETRPFTVHHRTFAVPAYALTLTVSQLTISDAVKAQRRAPVGSSRPLMGGCGTVIGSLNARHRASLRSADAFR